MQKLEFDEVKFTISEIIVRTGKFPTADDWQEIKLTLWNEKIKWLEEAAVMRTQEWKQEYEQEVAVVHTSTGFLGESADYEAAVKAGGTSSLVSAKGVTTRTLNHPGI